VGLGKNIKIKSKEKRILGHIPCHTHFDTALSLSLSFKKEIFYEI